jgi:hypothetical protein
VTHFALIIAQAVVTGADSIVLEVASVSPDLTLEMALAQLARRPRGTAAIIRRLPAALPAPGDVLSGDARPSLAARQAVAMARRAKRQRDLVRVSA